MLLDVAGSFLGTTWSNMLELNSETASWILNKFFEVKHFREIEDCLKDWQHALALQMMNACIFHTFQMHGRVYRADESSDEPEEPNSQAQQLILNSF